MCHADFGLWHDRVTRHDPGIGSLGTCRACNMVVAFDDFWGLWFTVGPTWLIQELP